MPAEGTLIIGFAVEQAIALMEAHKDELGEQAEALYAEADSLRHSTNRSEAERGDGIKRQADAVALEYDTTEQHQDALRRLLDMMPTADWAMVKPGKPYPQVRV